MIARIFIVGLIMVVFTGLAYRALSIHERIATEQARV